MPQFEVYVSETTYRKRRRLLVTADNEADVRRAVENNWHVLREKSEPVDDSQGDVAASVISVMPHDPDKRR